jgi:hypothetical protein
MEEGATIEVDGKWLWTKICDNKWGAEDGFDTVDDAEMEQMLARPGSQQIIVEKDVQSEPVVSYDLEEGDYVLMTWGFWHTGEAMCDPGKSQVLFRVAGWLNSDGDDNWVIGLDAPENVLWQIGWSEFPDEGVGNELDPQFLYVGPQTNFQYVIKGQDHLRWDDYDWSGSYNLVGPPDEPS